MIRDSWGTRHGAWSGRIQPTSQRASTSGAVLIVLVQLERGMSNEVPRKILRILLYLWLYHTSYNYGRCRIPTGNFCSSHEFLPSTSVGAAGALFLLLQT